MNCPNCRDDSFRNRSGIDPSPHSFPKRDNGSQPCHGVFRSSICLAASVGFRRGKSSLFTAVAIDRNSVACSRQCSSEFSDGKSAMKSRQEVSPPPISDLTPDQNRSLVSVGVRQKSEIESDLIHGRESLTTSIFGAY